MWATVTGGGAETGQLKIWSSDEIDALLALGAEALDYLATGDILAEGVLSAAFLGVDSENNLYVGGGDVFGSSGNMGYAALVNASVLERVLDGGAPADLSSPE